jgi:hypothetical protein
LSLEKLVKDPEVIMLLEQQTVDYMTSLGGRLPFYDVKVPAALTKEKFYEIQNQITKGKHRETQPLTYTKCAFAKNSKSTVQSSWRRIPASSRNSVTPMNKANIS